MFICMINVWVVFFYEYRPAYTPVGYVWTSIYSMEKRCCKRCNSSRGAGAAALYEDRKYCTICLDVEKEKHRRIRENRLEYFEKYHEEHQEERKDYRKGYSQIEIACAVCKCTVRKCGWAKKQKNIELRLGRIVFLLYSRIHALKDWVLKCWTFF